MKKLNVLDWIAFVLIIFSGLYTLLDFILAYLGNDYVYGLFFSSVFPSLVLSIAALYFLSQLSKYSRQDGQLKRLDWVAFILLMLSGLNWSLVVFQIFDIFGLLYFIPGALELTPIVLGAAGLYVLFNLRNYSRK